MFVTQLQVSTEVFHNFTKCSTLKIYCTIFFNSILMYRNQYFILQLSILYVYYIKIQVLFLKAFFKFVFLFLFRNLSHLRRSQFQQRVVLPYRVEVCYRSRLIKCCQTSWGSSFASAHRISLSTYWQFSPHSFMNDIRSPSKKEEKTPNSSKLF